MIAPIFVTLKLALISTGILFIIGMPIAYILAFMKFKGKLLFENLINIPLILPPSALGFYLLTTLGPTSFIGKMFEAIFDKRLVFSFLGLVIGASISSLPFMVNTIKAGFKLCPKNLIEASYSLGKSRSETFLKIIIPNARPAIISGIILSFVHAMGAFGIVLMMGGNIPGETQTASVALYSAMESLDFSSAHIYSLILISSAFLALSTMHFINKRKTGVFL